MNSLIYRVSYDGSPGSPSSPQPSGSSEHEMSSLALTAIMNLAYVCHLVSHVVFCKSNTFVTASVFGGVLVAFAVPAS